MDARLRQLERQAFLEGDLVVFERFARSWLRSVGSSDLFHFRVMYSDLFDELPCNAQGRPEYKHRSSGIVMVQVPAGEFVPTGRTSPVKIPRPFLVAKYPVTQSQWRKIMEGNPSRNQGNLSDPRDPQGRLLDRNGKPFDDHPVEMVSWSDSLVFCRKTHFRLPSEAMWSYVVQAGMSAPGLVDSDPELSRGLITVPPAGVVGQGEANSWGVYDLGGSVWQLIQDRWDWGAPFPQPFEDNAFVAQGDTTGYNNAFWLSSGIIELAYRGYGASPRDSTKPREPKVPLEPRRIRGYGISAPIESERSQGVSQIETLDGLGQPVLLRRREDPENPTRGPAGPLVRDGTTPKEERRPTSLGEPEKQLIRISESSESAIADKDAERTSEENESVFEPVGAELLRDPLEGVSLTVPSPSYSENEGAAQEHVTRAILLPRAGPQRGLLDHIMPNVIHPWMGFRVCWG